MLPPAVTEGAALTDEGFKTEGGPDMAEKNTEARVEALCDAINKSYRVLEVKPGHVNHSELFRAILDAADAIRKAEDAWGDEWTL